MNELLTPMNDTPEQIQFIQEIITGIINNVIY